MEKGKVNQTQVGYHKCTAVKLLEFRDTEPFSMVEYDKNSSTEGVPRGSGQVLPAPDTCPGHEIIRLPQTQDMTPVPPFADIT